LEYFSKDEEILNQESIYPNQCIYVINEGRVGIFDNGGNKNNLLKILEKGEYFSEYEFFTND
jgi:signal-transduction protein with cAMP-binding, CBS, and nucleotidyltransferase domain